MGDEDDLPWLSNNDQGQLQEELHFLKTSRLEGVNPFRDQVVLYFNPDVIMRYRKHKYCKVEPYGTEFTIHFLEKDGTTAASFSCFFDRGKIKAQAREFVNCPPKERKYWERYQLRPEDVQEERLINTDEKRTDI